MPLFKHLKEILNGSRLDVSKRFTILAGPVSGTMSKFYKATDFKTGEVVGLKILDPIKTAAFESRFKGLHKPSEGEIAVQFKHPNIVNTFEYGTTVDGSPYLVMEYLEGPPLGAMSASRLSHPIPSLVCILREAAQAVAAVHEAGFIHRNVCPRNFLLTNHNQDLKLIDFSLSVPATKWFMQPGNRTGTPQYMAPELVHRHPTDQRLDVFSFGVTAYELCTSRLPWPRNLNSAAAMTYDQPPEDIRRHCPKMPSALAKAIHSCLEPELSRRCPSMATFLRWIRNVPEDDEFESLNR
jgi:eukaryotic-like serine/threonine-protein kinase